MAGPALVGGQKAFRAFVAPFDGSAKVAGGVHHRRVFRIRRAFHAKGTADIAGQHPHLFRGHIYQFGEPVVQAEHTLAAGAHGPLIGCRVEIDHRHPRLHRRNHDAVVDQVQARDMRGAGESGGDRVAVAIVEIEGDVARRLGPDLRRPRGDCRQRVAYRR